MKRQAFAVKHRIDNSINWYGAEYNFLRPEVNKYNEPLDSLKIVEVVNGIYHSSQQSFIELINTENASVKSKTNKGILCLESSGASIIQGDIVYIEDKKFKVTAVEPIMYCDHKVATEISVEEVLQ